MLWLSMAAAMALVATGCARIASPSGWAGPVSSGGIVYASIESGKLAALDVSACLGQPATSPSPGATASPAATAASSPGPSTAASPSPTPTAACAPKWVFPPKTDEGDKLKLEGIYGAPQVGKDTIYFGAYDGYVYALSASDGSQRWRFDTGAPVIGGLALTEDNRLYATSTNGTIYLLDPDKGSEVHRFDAGAGIWATPLVTKTAVYVGSVDGKLQALDPMTLAPLWTQPFKAGAGLITDPVPADEKTVLVGGIDENLYALDAATGTQKWSFGGGNWFWGRPLVDKGTVYAPNLDGNVYALDAASGSRKWTFVAPAPVRSAPLLAGGLVVVIDKNGKAFGLDPASGKASWGPPLLNKPVLSDPMVFGDKVLIVAQGGALFTVNPQDGSLAPVNVTVP